MTPNVHELPWDTHFFGYSTGRIDMPTYDEGKLVTLLGKARQRGFRLLYIVTQPHAVLSPTLLNTYKITLVDTKRTYAGGIGPAEPSASAPWGDIRKFSPNHNRAQLYELAYQSGAYSRFRTDPAIGEANFKRLYRQWIDNSLSGELADATFVYILDDVIRGFVTLQKNEPVARIGLIATDRSARGRGIGTALLNYVKQELRPASVVRLEVATQKENMAACRFYERNGFAVTHETPVYHAWL